MYDELLGRYLLASDTLLRLGCGMVALMVLVADASPARLIWSAPGGPSREPWLERVGVAPGGRMRQGTGNCAAAAWGQLGVNLDRLRPANDEQLPPAPASRGA